jgi:hypothetical protein
MFLSATSHRQIAFVNQSPGFTPHAFKRMSTLRVFKIGAFYLHNVVFILVAKAVENVVVVVVVKI